MRRVSNTHLTASSTWTWRCTGSAMSAVLERSVWCSALQQRCQLTFWQRLWSVSRLLSCAACWACRIKGEIWRRAALRGSVRWVLLTHLIHLCFLYYDSVSLLDNFIYTQIGSLLCPLHFIHWAHLPQITCWSSTHWYLYFDSFPALSGAFLSALALM